MELFDEEEQYVLINHQNEYLKSYGRDQNFTYNMNNKKSEPEEVEIQGRNDSGSIFGLLESPRSDH